MSRNRVDRQKYIKNGYEFKFRINLDRIPSREQILCYDMYGYELYASKETTGEEMIRHIRAIQVVMSLYWRRWFKVYYESDFFYTERVRFKDDEIISVDVKKIVGNKAILLTTEKIQMFIEFGPYNQAQYYIQFSEFDIEKNKDTLIRCINKKSEGMWFD